MIAGLERIACLAPLGVAVWAVFGQTSLPKVLIVGGGLVISTRWLLLALFGTIAAGPDRTRWRIARITGLAIVIAAAATLPGQWLVHWWSGTPWLAGSRGWIAVAVVSILGWLYQTGDPVVISAATLGGCLGGGLLWPLHAIRALLGYGALPFLAASVFHPNPVLFDPFMFMVLLELVLAGRTVMIVQAHARADALTSLTRPKDVPFRL